MTQIVTPDIAAGATSLLTIDLAAIGENYSKLQALANGAECAAVVKADAYGLGAARVAPFLAGLGCRTFCVATPGEGIVLRKILSDARIFILDGLFAGTGGIFAEHNLCPVLGSLKMIERWSAFCALRGQMYPAALHFDTGMNRLGLGADETKELSDHSSSILRDMQIELVISHLACADDPEHAANRKQQRLFSEILQTFPSLLGSQASLANSAGLFLGTDYSFDLVRPGIALYGGQPNCLSSSMMTPVVTLTTHIAQIRTVKKGDLIGYGGACRVERNTRVATLPVGYADGYHRTLGSTNENKGANTYIGEHKAPLLGRVSMDLVTIDITDIPVEEALVGTPVELLGQHVSIDDLAGISGTISYEILTSLGARYERQYTGDN